MTPPFRNNIEDQAWRETWCRKCFQPDEARKRVADQGEGCPHLLQADRGHTPRVWTRRRDGAIGNTYRCDDYLDKPPATSRRVTDDTQDALFDAPLNQIVTLVPVAGWPDYRSAQRPDDVEHQ